MFDLEVVGYVDVMEDGFPAEVQVARLDECIWYIRKERYAAMEQTSWSKDWPTDPGCYWFYGWCWKDRNYDPEMHFVRIELAARRHPVYITGGHFIWRMEGGEGYWMPARMPEPPEQFRGKQRMKQTIRHCEDCIFYRMIDSGYGDCTRYPPRLVLVKWLPRILYDALYPHVGWCELACGEFLGGKEVSSDG